MQTQTQLNDGAAAMPRRAYSIAKVASLMGVHRATVHRLVQAGKLRAISGFGVMKVSDVEIDRFLNATEVYKPSEVKSALERRLKVRAVQ